MGVASKVKGLSRKIAKWGRKGTIPLVDWIKGIIVLSILGVGVAIPIVVNTVQSVTVNDTTTQLILTFIPPILAVSILLGYLGR